MDRFLELAAGYSAAFQSSSLVIEMTPRQNMAYLAVLSARRAASLASAPSDDAVDPRYHH
jgi:hypothetical protein